MRVHRCVTPGTALLVDVIGGTSPSPNSDSSTVAMALALMQYAHGYSGCIGVSMSGSHAGSISVASFPSMSPLRADESDTGFRPCGARQGIPVVAGAWPFG
jgi:hypothetical protein